MVLPANFYFHGSLRSDFGFPTPNYAAAFFAPLIPWIWGLIALTLRAKEKPVHNVGFFGAIALEGIVWVCLIVTLSRGGFFSACVAAIAFLMSFKACVNCARAVLVRVALLGILLFFTNFSSRIGLGVLSGDASVTHRLTLWKAGLEMMAIEPTRGWGAGESGRAYMNWFQDQAASEKYTTMVSTPMTIAVEHGLPLLAAIIFAHLLLVGSGILFSKNNAAHASTASIIVSCAQASVVAWAVANCFSTLWGDIRLWVVPSISYSVLILTAALSLKRVASKLLAITLAVTVSITFVLYFGGRAFLGTLPLKINRIGESGIEISNGCAQNNGAATYWNFWCDPVVAGPVPGKKLRQAIEGMPHGVRFIYHTPWTHEELGGENEIVLLQGAQIQRLSELCSGKAKPGKLYLEQPIGLPPLESWVPKPNLVPIQVFLSELDIRGENDKWNQFGVSLGGQVTMSRGFLADIASSAHLDVSSVLRKQTARAKSNTAGPVRTSSAGGHSGRDSYPNPGPEDEKLIASRLHNIGIHGSLVFRVPVFASDVLDHLRLRCDLEHHLDLDAWENGISRWDISSLHSWLIPSADGGRHWLSTDGLELIFRLEQIGSEFAPQRSNEFQIKTITPESYVVRSPTGVEWTYSNCFLSKIHSPILGNFDVTSIGGLLTDVAYRESGASRSILAARYDEYLRVTSLTTSEGGKASLTWNGGSLLRIDGGPDQTTRFAYSLGLLASIEGPHRHIEVRWQINNGYNKGDSLWFYPVHLRSFGASDYCYELEPNGYLITVSDRTTGIEEITRCNPARHELEQIDQNRRHFRYYY
jgi:hypothetical protein